MLAAFFPAIVPLHRGEAHATKGLRAGTTKSAIFTVDTREEEPLFCGGIFLELIQWLAISGGIAISSANVREGAGVYSEDVC